MSGPRGKSRRLSDGERVLWREITRSIAPLHPGTAVQTEAENDADDAPAVVTKLSAAKPLAKRPKAEPPQALAPLGRRARQRVARGRDSIDGRLDLHGLTQPEAHGALLDFLHAAQARGARLVMVITGKSGVLKRQVPFWLALPDFRAMIVGFDEAHQRHGGEGALYLRLRRTRATE